MLSLGLLFAIVACQTVHSIPIADSSIANLTASVSAGFTSPVVTFSQGGNAICASGKVPVSMTATTIKLLISEPANQTVVTEIIQELLQVDSTIRTTTNGGSVTTSGTFQIDVTYCIPANPVVNAGVKTIQLLTHGIGLDKTYWDISPGFSYVDAAALAGYATLAYNRLGAGASDHPDPIQVVQSTVDVEIQHGLAHLLRTGWINGRTFQHVVAVGHSYGSIVLLGQTVKYPTDVDAAVFTGFVADFAYLGYNVAANNPAIAAINNPSQFGGLPYGYFVHDTAISMQLPFFRHPYFPASTFNQQVAHKQPYSLGQQLTFGNIIAPAPSFTGPVDIVASIRDFPFCLADCSYPVDQAAATIPGLFPAASSGSQSFLVPDSGHSINAHYGAGAAFQQINAFLATNGF